MYICGVRLGWQAWVRVQGHEWEKEKAKRERGTIRVSCFRFSVYQSSFPPCKTSSRNTWLLIGPAAFFVQDKLGGFRCPGLRSINKREPNTIMSSPEIWNQPRILVGIKSLSRARQLNRSLEVSGESREVGKHVRR